jgi:imidazoleglycerol phosphate dehydratase HisB
MIEINRKTKETDIHVLLDMNAQGPSEPRTGVPFFDHMLNAMAFHGGFRLVVEASGTRMSILTTLWRTADW